MKTSKFIHWIVTLSLFIQVVASSTSSIKAFADGVNNQIEDLYFSNEAGEKLDQASILLGETVTTVLTSDHSLDQQVSVSILPGIELDQEATNRANQENNVTVAYSKEAGNILVNWVTQPQLTANETQESLKTEETTLAEKAGLLSKEEAEIAAKIENAPSVEEKMPQTKKVLLVFKGIKTGSHAVTAQTTRKGQSYTAKSLSVVVKEEDKAAETKKSEHEQKAQQVKATEVKTNFAVIDENGNELTNPKLATPSDYKKEVRFRMTITSEEDFTKIIFDNNLMWDLFWTDNGVTTPIDITYTDFSGNSSDAYYDFYEDMEEGFVGDDLPAGTYTYDFSLWLKLGVNYDSIFNVSSGFNNFKPDFNIYYETSSKKELSSSDFILEGTYPQATKVVTKDSLSGTAIPNVKLGVKNILADDELYIIYTDDHGVAYLPLRENKDASKYSIMILEAPGYLITGDNGEQYKFEFEGEANRISNASEGNPNELGLIALAPIIENKVTSDITEGYYGDKVTFRQEMIYMDGTEIVKAHFISIPSDAGIPQASARGLKKLPNPILIRYKDNVEVERISLNDDDVWQMQGSVEEGYILDYQIDLTDENNGFTIKEPLGAGEKLELVTEWIMTPKDSKAFMQMYTMSINGMGIDKNGKASIKFANKAEVMAHPKKAISLKVDKTVEVLEKSKEQTEKWVTTDTKDNKTTIIGSNKLRYDIQITAIGELYSQIKPTDIIDTLPAGINVSDPSKIKVSIDGKPINSKLFELNGNELSIAVSKIARNKLLSITNDPKDARMLITIEVELTPDASGILENTALVKGQVRENDFVDNSWGASVDYTSNSVENYIEPNVNIKKIANSVGYVGEPFEYSLVVTLDEESGALHNGVITDILPAGFKPVGNATIIIDTKPTTKLITDPALKREFRNVTSSWSQNTEGRDVLTISDLTMNRTQQAVITFKVIPDVSIAGEILKNEAEVSGTDKDKLFKTTDKDKVDTRFVFQPGELESAKSVFPVEGGAVGESNDGENVAVGDIIQYQIVVWNPLDENTAVRDIEIKDVIPEGLEYMQGTLTVTRSGKIVEDATAEMNTADPMRPILTVKIKHLQGTNQELDKRTVVTFNVRVTKQASGTLKNEAQVVGFIDKTPSQPDISLNPPNTSTTTVVDPEPIITKSIDRKFAFKDDVLNYELVISNTKKAGLLVNGKVTDQLPEEVAYKIGSTVIIDQNGVIHKGAQNDKYWNKRNFSLSGLTLKEGDTITIQYQVKVMKAVFEKPIINYAKITGTSNEGTDSKNYEKNAEAEFELVPSPGKLAATKEVYSLTEDGSLDSTINNGNVQVNDTIAYQISVANIGDRATEVKNVHLQDQLPKGLTYVPNSLELTIGDTVTALKDEDTINIEKQAIDALVGTLKGGEFATLTFKVTVTKEASGEITNIATSKGNVITEPTDPKLPEKDKPTKPAETNDSDPVQNHVPPKPTIQKEVGRNVGEEIHNAKENEKLQTFNEDTLTYTLTVANEKNAGVLFNGEIEDKKLPDEVRYIAESTEIHYEDGKIEKLKDQDVWIDGKLRITGFTLAENESFKVLFKVKVKSEQLKTDIVNKVSIKGTDKDKKAVIGNTAEAKFDIVASPGILTATKSVYSTGKNATNINGEKLQVGDQIQYRIVVKNDGKSLSTIKNITVSDLLPSSVYYVDNTLKVVGDNTAIATVTKNDQGEETLSVELKELTGGKSIDILLDVIVLDSASGEFTNTAQAEGEVALQPDNLTITKPSKVETNTVKNNVPIEPMITKTLDNQGVAFNDDEFYYTLVIQNKQNAGKLYFGEVEDRLPTGITYVANSTEVDGQKVNDDHWKDNTFNKKGIELLENQKMTIRFKVKINVKELQTITNTASFSGKDINGEGMKQVKSEVPVTVISNTGELEAEKAVYNQAGESINNGKVSVSDTIRYEIIVKNTTETPFSEVREINLNDEIPFGLTYVAGSLTLNGEPQKDDAVTLDSKTGSYHLNLSIGTLGSLATATVSFEVMVSKNASGTLKNIAIANGTTNKTPTETDTPTGDKPTPPVNNLIQPVPSIKKSVKAIGSTNENSHGMAPLPVFNEDELIYTLIVTNQVGAGLLKNGVVEDTLPPGLVYKPKSTVIDGKSVGDENWQGNTFKKETIELASGQKMTIRFTVKVAETEVPKDILNVATFVGEDGDGNQLPVVKDDVSVAIINSPGKLEAKKAVYGADGTDLNTREVKVGDKIRYEIVVSNSTETPFSEVRDVVVKDAIPAGLKYVKNTLTVNNRLMPNDSELIFENPDDPETELLEVSIGHLASKEQVVVSFEVEVMPNASGELTNIAVANGLVTPKPNEPAIPDSSQTPPVANEAPPKPSIEKSVSQETIFNGDTVIYTLIVRNQEGGGYLYNGVVTDKLPDGVIYQKGTTQINGKDATKDYWDGNQFTFDQIELASGEFITITFKAKVTVNKATEGILNKAIFNGTDKNNVPTAEVSDFAELNVVPRPGKIEPVKAVYNQAGQSIENQVVKIGDTLYYEIIVTNTEQDISEVRDIIVTDAIPTGLKYIKDTTTVNGKAVANNVMTDSNGDDHLNLAIGHLSSGEQAVIRFEVRVDQKADGRLTNIALVNGVVTPTPSDPKDPNRENLEIEETPTNSVENKIHPKPSIKKSVAEENTTNKTAVFNESTLIYTLILHNEAGASMLKNGTVEDHLPNEVQYQPETTTINGVSIKDNTEQLSWINNQFKLSPIQLAGGETMEIKFKVKVEVQQIATGILNTAYMNGTDSHNNPVTEQKDSAKFDVIADPGEIDALKSVYAVHLDGSDGDNIHNAVVNVNDTIRYKILVENTSEKKLSEVHDVIVEDLLPSGVSYLPNTLYLEKDNQLIQQSDEAVNQEKQFLSLNIGTLKSREKAVVIFDVKITNKASGTIANIATAKGMTAVNSEEPEKETELKETPNVLNNAQPEPNIIKTVTDGTPQFNGHSFTNTILTYQLVVSNAKNAGFLKEGVVTDTLPEGVRYQPNTTTIANEKVEDAAVWKNNSLTIKDIELAENEELMIEFKVLVTSLEFDKTIVNKARFVGANGDGILTDPVEDEAEFILQAGPGKLNSTKKSYQGTEDVSGKAVKVGDKLRYEIVVENSSMGPATVNGIVVKDQLPKGLSYIPGTLQLNSESLSDDHVVDQVITIKVGRLLSGEKAVISFEVMIEQGVTEKTTILNIADVTGTAVQVAGQPETVIEQHPSVDNKVASEVSMLKIVDQKDAKVGDVLTYELIVKNGPNGGPWSGQVIDTIPEHTMYLPDSTTVTNETGESINLSDVNVWQGHQWSVMISELQANQRVTIRFQVKITDISSDTATILNIASLVSDDPAITENQELDSNEVQTIVTKPVVPPATTQPNPLPPTKPVPPDNQKLPQTGDEGNQLIRQVGLLLLGLSTLYFTHKRRTRTSR